MSDLSERIGRVITGSVKGLCVYVKVAPDFSRQCVSFFRRSVRTSQYGVREVIADRLHPPTSCLPGALLPSAVAASQRIALAISGTLRTAEFAVETLNAYVIASDVHRRVLVRGSGRRIRARRALARAHPPSASDKARRGARSWRARTVRRRQGLPGGVAAARVRAAAGSRGGRAVPRHSRLRPDHLFMRRFDFAALATSRRRWARATTGSPSRRRGAHASRFACPFTRGMNYSSARGRLWKRALHAGFLLSDQLAVGTPAAMALYTSKGARNVDGLPAVTEEYVTLAASSSTARPLRSGRGAYGGGASGGLHVPVTLAAAPPQLRRGGGSGEQRARRHGARRASRASATAHVFSYGNDIKHWADVRHGKIVNGFVVRRGQRPRVCTDGSAARLWNVRHHALTAAPRKEWRARLLHQPDASRCPPNVLMLGADRCRTPSSDAPVPCSSLSCLPAAVRLPEAPRRTRQLLTNMTHVQLEYRLHAPHDSSSWKLLRSRAKGL